MDTYRKAQIGWFWRIALIATLLLIPANALASDQSGTEPLTPETLERYFNNKLTRQMADDHIAGATVAVVAEGELIFAKGYGFADVAAQKPVVADETLFYPGSVGKLFTWTAVMQLVEEGKLDLTTDINAYLDFPLPDRLYRAANDEPVAPITLAHLMTHTAGFEDQLAALQVAEGDNLLPLRDFLIEQMPARVYPPGQWFAYSNYGTALAGYIVARVAGEPFEQVIAERILEPLAMSHSAATQPLPPALMADYSVGYHFRNGVYEPVAFEWIADAPAAPIRATATDMAHFMIAHLDGGRYGDQRILQEASVEAMHTMQFAHDPWLMGMGYGFMISQENGHAVSWHTGGSAHFTTLLALIPDQDVGLYLSFNTPVIELREVLTDFMDHFYPAAADAPTQPPADTGERIAALAGTYVPSTMAYSTPQKIVSLFQQVTVLPSEQETLLVGPHEFVEVEPGRFQEVDGPRKLTYATGENGEVQAIYWGPFAYLRLPWHQTLAVQGALAAACLLLFASALLAWPVDALVRRRRGKEQSTKPAPRWAGWARWVAAILGALNIVLLAWFLSSMLAYAGTYVFPTATTALITRLWWIGVPLAAATVLFAVLAWQRRVWRPVWRVHYILVAVAAVTFLGLLMNWKLLM